MYVRDDYFRRVQEFRLGRTTVKSLTLNIIGNDRKANIFLP